MKVFIQKWNASLTIFRQGLQSPIDQQKICYLEVSERKIELASLAYPSVVSGGRIHYINFNFESGSVAPVSWIVTGSLSNSNLDYDSLWSEIPPILKQLCPQYTPNMCWPKLNKRICKNGRHCVNMIFLTSDADPLYYDTDTDPRISLKPYPALDQT